MEDMEAALGFAFYSRKLYIFQSQLDVTFWGHIFQCFCRSKSKKTCEHFIWEIFSEKVHFHPGQFVE